MKNFNRDRGERPNGGGKRFGGGRDFNRGDRGGRDFSRPSMHKAICDECGNECEVPFRPTGDKPIYCSNCFQGKRDGGGSSKFGKRDFKKSNFDDKKRYTAVCSKCGKSCEVPFRPTGKPVYCDECFGKGGGERQKGASCSKEQFDTLNAKLDKILKVLAPAISEDMVMKKKEAEKEVKIFEPKTPFAKKVATKKVASAKTAPKKPPVKKKK